MLVVRASAAVTFPGTRLTYSEGALHSDGDAPALSLGVGTKLHAKTPIAVSIFHEDVSGASHGVSGARGFFNAWWADHTFGEKEYYLPFNAVAEKRWYARGELHRDFGPAIAGYNASGVAVYWLKCARGVLGGDLRNSFDGSPAAYGNLTAKTSVLSTTGLLTACGGLPAHDATSPANAAPLPSKGKTFACAPGAVICAFSVTNFHLSQFLKGSHCTRMYTNGTSMVGTSRPTHEPVRARTSRFFSAACRPRASCWLLRLFALSALASQCDCFRRCVDVLRRCEFLRRGVFLRRCVFAPTARLPKRLV
jgi:hypothetical protein